MDSRIILGRLIQRLLEDGYAQVMGYIRFNFIELTDTALKVDREADKYTLIPFERILKAIEGYQGNPSDYEKGPTTLREYGISHVTSPIFALLHLLPIDVYK